MESSPERTTLNFAHKWIINNFSSLYDDSTWRPSFLVSENFSPLARDTLDAYIELSTKDCEGYLSMFICIDASHYMCDLIVNYKLAIQDVQGETFCCKESQSSFTCGTARLGWSKYTNFEHLLSEENEVLLNNKVTVFCEVSILMPKFFKIKIAQTPRVTRSFYDAQSVLSPFHIKWTVDNLTQFRNEKNVEFYPVDSDIFSYNNDEVKFYLKLCPINENNNFKILLVFKSKVFHQIKVQFRLTFISDKRENFVMSSEEYLTANKGFGWFIPFVKQKDDTQSLIFIEAYINENLKVPFKVNTINENLNTAISSFYSVTKKWKNYFDTQSKTCKEIFDEKCKLITEVPVVESYFNGNPKVLDTLIHTWSIYEYSDFLNDYDSRKVLESDKFYSTRNTNLTFLLRIHQKEYTHSSCAVYLVYCNRKRENIKVQLLISVIDKNGDKKKCKVLRHNFGENTNPFYIEDYLGFNFVDNEYLLNKNEKLLPKDTLTLHCEVQIIDDRKLKLTKKSAESSNDCQSEPHESDLLL